MKKYIQPNTNIQTLETGYLCQSMYNASVVDGDPGSALSPGRNPGVSNYATKTLYI